MRGRGRAALPCPVARQALARRRRRVLVVLPHVPGLDSDFGRSLLSQMGIAAVFALSFNMLLGQTACCRSVTPSTSASAATPRST